MIRTDESGMSLVEVSIAGGLMMIVFGAFFTFFMAFNNDVLRQEQRATTMSELRPALAEMVIELRQAIDPLSDGVLVESLDSAWPTAGVTFYTNMHQDTPGPERVRYYLDNCVGSVCELWRDVSVADSGPPWVYGSIGTSERVVTRLRTDATDPLFQGVSWQGGAEAVTTDCDTTTVCEFEVIRIRITVDTGAVTDPSSQISIQEEVRFRNAPR